MSERPLQYPRKLAITPAADGVTASVAVPGSKSITNRALVLAALNARAHDCTLHNVLHSEDTDVMLDALMDLGFWVQVDEANASVHFRRHGGQFALRPAELFVANSGTTMRFLTALCSLGNVPIRLDGVPRMRERPIADLLDGLSQVGVEARSEANNGCPPVVIRGNGQWGWNNDRVWIRGDTSSQFLSALLMAAPHAARGRLTIEIDGPLVSVPYVGTTLRMMEQFGTPITSEGSTFRICQGEFASTAPEQYTIEPDASAASYFFAAAAILEGRVTVLDLPEDSLQGDICFIDVLEQMGCRIEKCASGITVHGRPLHGIDADMNHISDMVLTLAAVACFAEGPTTVRNVAHIRYKETNRIAALATELRKVGVVVEELADGLKITPGPLHGAEIDTYNDHRMAMSMALVGLKVPGIVIRNPGCVAKTYPDFWDDLERLVRQVK
jgi:3-phosphoshikimate 1-carboxyvinyltransferase